MYWILIEILPLWCPLSCGALGSCLLCLIYKTTMTNLEVILFFWSPLLSYKFPSSCQFIDVWECLLWGGGTYLLNHLVQINQAIATDPIIQADNNFDKIKPMNTLKNKFKTQNTYYWDSLWWWQKNKIFQVSWDHQDCSKYKEIYNILHPCIYIPHDISYIKMMTDFWRFRSYEVKITFY